MQFNNSVKRNNLSIFLGGRSFLWPEEGVRAAKSVGSPWLRQSTKDNVFTRSRAIKIYTRYKCLTRCSGVEVRTHALVGTGGVRNTSRSVQARSTDTLTKWDTFKCIPVNKYINKLKKNDMGIIFYVVYTKKTVVTCKEMSNYPNNSDRKIRIILFLKKKVF